MLGPAISNDTLAQRLGLSQLRLGYQTEPGLPVGHQLLVNAYWVLTACPSFAHGWKLGAVAVEDVIDRVPTFRHRHRAFFATDSFVESAELSETLIGSVFAGADLFTAVFPERCRVGDRWLTALPLDGISYDLEWETQQVRNGRLGFSNPRTEPMVALERRLFEFADHIRRATDSERVREFLELWQTYCARRKPAEPAAAPDPART